jgi:hypothetical protein
LVGTVKKMIEEQIKTDSEVAIEPEPLRLDLGAGINRRPGFTSVDIIPFEGLDIVADLTEPWPWEDGSVEEIHMSHFLEHFTPPQRCHILNEAYRVLKDDRKATIICPNWSSSRAYGDPTHQWPPLGGFFFNYLRKEWRDTQAPHTDASNIPRTYSCDFEWTYGYGLHPEVVSWNDERRTYAMTFLIEACPDIIATITKRPA